MAVVTAKEMAKLLESNGFTLLHQKGSHKKYVNGNVFAILVYHGNDKESLSTGVVKNIKKAILKSKENEANISGSNSTQ